eukprot:TRINITY_DN25748_c0_g1_i1.p1 TRINITY_DN25748_c0_g1~~TRINITY_DN25748_c0_g1_i1.p1  ORF type:complete len:257 (+),score=39.33 TRINITY_DN25748_c0_g1_i1:52-822(+)
MSQPDEEPHDVEDAVDDLRDADVLRADTPYLRLRRAWLNERSHTDLLPYAAAEVHAVAVIVQRSSERDYTALERSMKQKQRQQRARAAAAAGELDDDEVDVSTLEYPLGKLFALEADRLRFLLADYHRTRTLKLSTYHHHALRRHETDPGAGLLCAAEVVFARRVAEADAELFGGTLGRLPPHLRPLYTVTLPDGRTASVHPRPARDASRVFMVVADPLVVALPGGAEVTMSRGDVAATTLDRIESHVVEGRAVLL